MMRLAERLAVRASLPLHYSQGFNPRPAISFASPRPVAVASQGDLLVACLDEPVEAAELLSRLNDHAPAGLRAVRAELLPGKAAARPKAIRYELALEAARIPAVRQRLAQLAGEPCWIAQRRHPARNARQGPTTQPIDLRPLVAEVNLDDSVLRITLVPKGDLWARPGEVLALLGLDERFDLAATVRRPMELKQ